MKFRYSIIFVLAVFAGSIFSSCVRTDEFPPDSRVECSAEKKVPKKPLFYAENDSSYVLSGGNKQTSKLARTGKHALYLTPKKQYGFTFKIKNAGPDYYYRVSVWRKSKNDKGVLVASSVTPKLLYQLVSEPVEVDENGWEKLEMEVFTPPGFHNESLKFYVWDNGTDTVYFDDFVLERLSHKEYPEYKEEHLAIILDTSQYQKILNKRKAAFEIGVLQTEEDDWVKGIVFGEGKMMKAKMRLKGDWLDHLRGNKWSFRIKMRKNYAWNRLREFSIQTPEARNFLWEWVSHKMYQQEDILTTRYGFVPVTFNNSNRGLYAWEEHFVKQLLEWRKRREGPIVRFSEAPFWQSRKQAHFEGKTWIILPYLEASVIEPFKEKRTVANPTLYAQFLNAQKLMQQFRLHARPPAEIFDLDKLAAHYAMLDLNQARHGMAWHNHRYYFNPVTCKLEPIAYDGYAEYSKPYMGITSNFAWGALVGRKSITPEQYLTDDLMLDSVFTDKYLYYLEKFSSKEYIENTMARLMPEIRYYDSLINLEFPYVHFDTSYYRRSAESIRNYLPQLRDSINAIQHREDFAFNVRKPQYTDTTIHGKTPEFYVTAFLEKTEDDSVTISVYNYLQRKIIILGTGRSDKHVQFYQLPEPRLDAYTGDEERSLELKTDTGSNYLFFMVNGLFETYKIRIYPWPFPKGETPQQELMALADVDNEAVFEKRSGNKLYLRADSLRIDKPLIIPQGYEVHFRPGTVLDLVNHAMFISYSPVFLEGTSKNPVVLTSSDFTGNGFTVIQAKGRSRLKNVQVKNMNTLNYKGWMLTGAVTFYESDVDIVNTGFYRNQCEDALNVIRSDFHLQSSSFDHIYADAFDSDFSTGVVSDAEFTNIGNDAIDFSGSEILIRDTRISDVADKGVSGGEESHLKVENTSITHANIGLASKDLSVVTVNNSQVTDCNYGLVLLQKKPEYGPATLILDNTTITGAQTEMLIEKGSKVVMDGKTIEGQKEKLAEIFY